MATNIGLLFKLLIHAVDYRFFMLFRHIDPCIINYDLDLVLLIRMALSRHYQSEEFHHK